MANLHSFDNKLQIVKDLILKLNIGKLSAEEIETLVESTRDLYERSVILQYKSFEEKVFGVKEVEEIEDSIIEKTEEEEEEIQQEELQEEALEIEESTTEQPAFDFSLFDEPVPLTPIDEKEMVSEDNVDIAEENEVHTSENHSTQIQEEKIAEQVVVEQTIVTFGSGEASALASHLVRLIDQSDKEFNMPPLDTLVGTFGLNERLQYINELFNGSSEEFAEAIKSLDSASGFDEALNKAATFGLRNQWDRESETVLDFVTKIKRRYV